MQLHPFVLQRLSNQIEGPSPNEEAETDDRVDEDNRSPNECDYFDRAPHCAPVNSPQGNGEAYPKEVLERSSCDKC
jgi:hypothetical protein